MVHQPDDQICADALDLCSQRQPDGCGDAAVPFAGYCRRNILMACYARRDFDRRGAPGRPKVFLGVLGMSAAALFSLAIVVQGAAILFLNGCER